MENGGLDFSKPPLGVFMAWQLSATQRLFSFAVVRQI